ncbi:MAG TPA: DUF1800 domain-containing protein [Capsulimonadaceae bacterium]|jgi:uncharacterized protein (DUF1800 family)
MDTNPRLATTKFDGSPASYEDMAHLLRRAGFGASPQRIWRDSQRGLGSVTRELIEYAAIPDDIDDGAFLQTSLQVVNGANNLMLADAELKTPAVRLWWIYRILATRRPLQEKMVLFWHNHFTSKDDDGVLMLRQNRLFRTHALGNFRDLAQAVSRDPEMVRYLNGDQNYREHPNENYARELMELFTCGRVGPSGAPNYTEDDIKAAARAFSGWNLRNGRFYYNPAEHDETEKTFMGRTAAFTGSDIVDHLVALPATAHYLCRKLYRYFCAETPSERTMSRLTSVYFNSGYNIKAIVTDILTSQEFYSPAARYGLIKSPVDLVIGALNMTGMSDHVAPYIKLGASSGTPLDPMDDTGLRTNDFNDNATRARALLNGLSGVASEMASMGQELLGPPTVKGWDGGRLWINLNTMIARARFAQKFSQRPGLRVSLPPDSSGASNALRTVEADAHPFASEPERLVDALLWMCGPLNVSAPVRQVLIDQTASETDAGRRVRTALGLILSSPDYQLC